MLSKRVAINPNTRKSGKMTLRYLGEADSVPQERLNVIETPIQTR
jgi:hypothetical protein